MSTNFTEENSKNVIKPDENNNKNSYNDKDNNNNIDESSNNLIIQQQNNILDQKCNDNYSKNLENYLQQHHLNSNQLPVQQQNNLLNHKSILEGNDSLNQTDAMMNHIKSNHHQYPPYVSLVQEENEDEDVIFENSDDIEDGFSSKKSILNSNNNNNIILNNHHNNISNNISKKLNVEPLLNCHKIEIVRTRPKQSFRTSIMVLFKSCFIRGPMMKRIMSALFFAISSFFLVVINKIVLTTYHFPSVMILGLGQVIATIVILNICRRLNIIKFPYYTREVNSKLFPLPFFYLGNLVAGLGSTKLLNLPMLTVLRRFTILMTMIGEYYLLGVNQSLTIKMTVFMMIAGAIIAASNDLAFDAAGYVYVLLNDVFSTFNGIYMKKKLDSRDLGKYGILYYNALFIVVPLFIISLCVDDWQKCFLEFEHWHSPMFVLSFLMSCIMGFILMYSTALCTQHNSALTTTIVGCLKNILVTFIGMYIGGDYIFSMVNFIGLNISMIGSLIYSYVIFVHKSGSSTASSTSSSKSSSSSSTTINKPTMLPTSKQ